MTTLGIGDCAQAVCYTITTDIAVYNKDTVTHIFGVLAGMYGLGFVVGPLLGGRYGSLCYSAGLLDRLLVVAWPLIRPMHLGKLRIPYC